MELLIRRAQSHDAQALYAMLCDLENKQLDEPNFTSVFLKNLENKYVTYLIAELNNRPIGMASCHVQLLLHHTAPIGEIQEMYVNPEFRSQGIGQRLVKEILAFARQLGANQLEVTSNQIRSDTHRFYEREGFRRTHYKMVREGEREEKKREGSNTKKDTSK